MVHKTSGASTISSESTTWDDAGNLSEKTVDTLTTTYGYDDIDQLVSESRSGYSASYAYDANGKLPQVMKRLKTYSIGCGVVLAALAFNVFAIVASHRDLWCVRIENTRDTKLRLISLKGAAQEVFCGPHSTVNWPDLLYQPDEPPFEAQLPDGQRIEPRSVRMDTPFILGDAVLVVTY